MSLTTHALSGSTTDHSFRLAFQPTSCGSQIQASDHRSRTPLPFYLWCVGGQWKGHLLRWEKESVHAKITGFPPITVSQLVHLQVLLQNPQCRFRPFQAIIEDLRVEMGANPWQGTTDVFFKIESGTDIFDHLPFIMNTQTSERNEGVVFGRVVNRLPASRRMKPSDPPEISLSLQPSLIHARKEQVETGMPSSQPTGRIVSALLKINKNPHQCITAYHDRPAEKTPVRHPVVIISPGYGETKRDYLTMAYFLAGNGFQVVRYDHTNHVGESDGVHYYASLSSMKEDFQAVVRFAKNHWPDSPLIAVASSLASRAAIKAEAESPSLSLLIMLMGIVNVQRSAATVHQEDLFARYAQSPFPDSENFLGFNVGPQFIHDALINRFVTLEHTLADAERFTAPVIMVSAGKDAWVDHEDLLVFRKHLGRRVRQWIKVPEALHRLQENPRVARDVYRQVVVHCLEQAATHPSNAVIHSPDRVTLGRQHRKEKFALQRQAETEIGPAFWEDYLENFQSVDQCPDYVKLLDHVFHALGPLSPGQQVLDAGCGNGNAARFLLHWSQDHGSNTPPVGYGEIQYVGIDVIPEALSRANRTLLSARQERQTGQALPPFSLMMRWSQVDLNHPLPFSDNQFDRIISNLVLGYLRNPRAALQELYRVLAPAGRMVLSNLKPNGDFSGIYQSLVKSAMRAPQRIEARELLNNYGKIRQAEKDGRFSFYDRKQWERVMADLGCRNAKIFPTFAGQAYLIILEKPAMPTSMTVPHLTNSHGPLSMAA